MKNIKDVIKPIHQTPIYTTMGYNILEKTAYGLPVAELELKLRGIPKFFSAHIRTTIKNTHKNHLYT